ncbi:hypothetical protein C8A03DRAFT_36499, partial [Achaetomium macrosporum]
EQALEEYFAATKRTDEEKESIRSIKHAGALLARVEAASKSFVVFRANHARLREILGRVIWPITIVAKVAADAIASSLALLSVVLGAIGFLVKSAQGVSAVYDSIEDLFDKLSAFASRLELYLEGQIDAKLQDLVVRTPVCILRITARAEKVVRDGRWKKYTQLLVLGGDEKIKELLSDLSRLVDGEQRLIAAMAYSINPRVNSKADTLVEFSNKSLGELQQVRTVLQDIRPDIGQALLEDHLMTDAYRKSLAIYHEYRETALKSSGEWLLAEPGFLSWLSRKSRTLFIRGGPGTGKSYLSSISITKAKTTYPSDDSDRHRTSVAYFYIKEHDQDLLHLTNILKSLAYQICQSDSAFHSHAVQVLSKPESVVTPRMLWTHLSVDFFHSSESQSSVLIILDGLDEALRKTQRDIFALLASTCPPAGQAVSYRILVAVFAWPEVSENFPAGFRRGLAMLEIGNKNEGDIAAYVKEHSICESWWCARPCDSRRRKPRRETRAAVFAAIDVSPPGLNVMISHVFERLLLADEDADVNDFREMLLWICFAKRPLYLAELYSIVRERTGRPLDALEARMRGRFATLFKLGSGSGSEERHLEPPPVPENDEDFDMDDAEFDSDNDSSGSPDNQDRVPLGIRVEPGRKYKDAANSTLGLAKDKGTLNNETIQRFWAVDVRFSHASIREFLVSNSAARLGIAIMPSTADAAIASRCMQLVLQTYNPVKMMDSCNHVWYATTYLADHLMSVDLALFPRQQQQELVTDFCKLFFNRESLLGLIERLFYCCYNKALHQFFVDPAFLTAIQTRFLPRAREEWFTPDEWAWIQTCLCKPAEFLRPLARQAARLWLTRTGHDDDAYLWSGRRQLFHEGRRERSDDIDIGRLAAEQPPDIDIDTARVFLEFDPSLEKTCHLHTASGWLLYECGHIDAAAEEFAEAIRLDSRSWSALRGLGLCSARVMEYDKAGEQIELAIQRVPARLDDALRALRRDRVSILVSQRGSALHKAVNLVREMARNVPDYFSDLGTAMLYIRAMYGAGDFAGVRDVYRDGPVMREQWFYHPAYGCQDAEIEPVFAFSEARLEIGRALRATGSLDLLMVPIQRFLHRDTVDTMFARSPWVAAWLIEMLYECSENIDAALPLCERVLDPAFAARIHPDRTWGAGYPVSAARTHASQIYYLGGVAALTRGDAAEVHTYVDKLKDLLSVPYGDRESVEMLLAILMRRAGGRYRSEWKQVLGPKIVDSLRELAFDSQESTSTHASIHDLTRLSNVLLAAGDAINASAVIALSLEGFPPFQGEAEWCSKGRRRTWWLCDGLCTTDLDTIYNEVYDELFFCTECFCGPCHAMVRTGKLPFRKCDPDHKLVKMFPVPTEWIGVAGRVNHKGSGAGSEELQFEMNQE